MHHGLVVDCAIAMTVDGLVNTAIGGGNEEIATV